MKNEYIYINSKAVETQLFYTVRQLVGRFELDNNVRPMNWFRHHSQVTTSNGKDSNNRWSRAGPDGWGPC